mmetsp:Transcript_666/g.1549  ORF Transcript_666/g.1549 Transcript_666/m.1549 type:complete len:1617 (-) Transcript_666:372-5222(-)
MRSLFRKSSLKSSTRTSNNYFSVYLEQLDGENSSLWHRLQQFDYHTFKHGVLHVKYNTVWGLWWDVLLVLFSLVACAIYVMETYWATYNALQAYTLIENVITQFFLLDFLLGWIAAHSSRIYFSKSFTWIDLATIAPVYLNYVLSGSTSSPNLSLLRFLRILRLVRILKTFRLLGGMNGVKRQTVMLSLALVSLIFLAAGLIHIFENEIQQVDYDCQYIGVLTNFEPSCDASQPTFDDFDCDCKSKECIPYYMTSDTNHKPSAIKCQNFKFFDSLFLVIITIYPVGYGSMIVTDASRAALVLLIIVSLIVIPIQINKLALLIKMSSNYRRPFERLPYENHVLLCGFCNDKEKLCRLLREFFNPDRNSVKTQLFHMVIMTPQEPHDDVVDLMNSPLFDSRLTYIIGSALDEKDLLKARADVASAIFFISDSQADSDQSTCEDAATVLRTLSIINYNPDLECFVEVLNEHDKRTLEDCHADVVLCLDDYKFALQARNSICMGLSTLCENLFNSFSDTYEDFGRKDHWMAEYTHGLGMEVYYFNIDYAFFTTMNYNWAILVECIYVEFGLLLIGVTRPSDHAVNMNPRNYEHKYPSMREYYKDFNVGIVIAPDYNDVLVMQYALSDMKCKYLMLNKLRDAEIHFTTRNASVFDPSKGRQNRSLDIIRQVSSLSATVDSENMTVDHVEHAKVLSSLMRTQRYFDIKYSLRKCYQQKPPTRRTCLMGLSLLKSPSITSSGQIDSDSDSDRDTDEFLGYIDEDTTTISRRASFNEMDDDSEEGNEVRLMSSINSVMSKSNTCVSRSRKSSMISENDGAEVSSTRPKKQRNTFIAVSTKDPNSAYEETHDPFRAGGHNLKALEKLHHTETATERELRKAKALAKFGGAARKVTHMVKDDMWCNAIAALNSPDEYTPSEFGLLDMPKITPLQRQIMQSKRKKKGVDTRISPTRTGRMVKLSSQIDMRASLALPDDGVKRTPSKSPVQTSRNTNPNPLDRPNSGNLADTLKKFQATKQKSFGRSNSRTLHRLKSSDFSSIEPLEKSSDKITLLSNPPPLSKRERIKSFESKGSRGSGVFSTLADGTTQRSDAAETKDKAIAHKLKKIHRALSTASSGRHDDVVEVDVGELMGVLSPAVKRTLSRSKSKAIADTKTGKLLRADSFEDKIASGGANAEEKQLKRAYRMPGEEMEHSSEISNARLLMNHVIVLGCMTHITKFVKVLRKSSLGTHKNFHSILIVSEDEPEEWSHIQKNYRGVYFMRRASVTDQDFLFMNLRSATSVTVLGSRDRETLDEATNIDSKVLFKYLAIQRKIPAHVSITVEIYRPSSVGVINSAISHHKVISSANIGVQSTGISRKQNSDKQGGLKIAGNDKASFHRYTSAFLKLDESDDEDEDDKSIKENNDGVDRRRSLFHGEKIAHLSSTAYQKNVAVGGAVPSKKPRGNRRLSVSGMAPLPDDEEDTSPAQSRGNRALNFWGSMDTHHVMPVFAAGRAFVPTAFDAIFIQSFFSSYSLQTCEKLVSGDEAQMMMKMKVPSSFLDRTYVDLFRALNVRGLLVMGLYRVPHRSNEAHLSYVFTNPPGDTLLHNGDQMYVFGHPELLKDAKKFLSLPFTYMKDGRVCMANDD